MKLHSTSIEIDADPERVWAVMTDFARWHEWTPTVTKIVTLDKDMLRVGARARILQPKLPPALWKVSEVTPAGFTWRSWAPGVSVVAKHFVELLGDGRSKATLSIAYGGPLGWFVAFLTRDINDRYLALEAAGLKARSENPAFRHTALTP